ncbi:MAG: cytochrome oxidase putative small subunit CydP [Pseudomonadota bacterium]
MKAHRPLIREISAALLFKVAGLLVLFVLFFSPSKRVDVTPESLGEVMIGPSQESGKP